MTGRAALPLVVVGAVTIVAAEPSRQVSTLCSEAQPSPFGADTVPLPPPPPTSPASRPADPGTFQFDSLVYEFLKERRYDDSLHWCVDSGVRDTGPYIKGAYFGTHPAVRIYYSPEVIRWLKDDRKGDLPGWVGLCTDRHPHNQLSRSRNEHHANGSTPSSASATGKRTIPAGHVDQD